MQLEGNRDIEVHVRWLIRRDMPEVLDIESTSFEFPWSQEDFIACLQQRNCIGMVAELDGEVVGYIVYEMGRSEFHVLNLAVRPDVRRRGVGQQLIQKIVGKLRAGQRTEVRLEVRETNLAAQLFFRRLSFQAVTVLKDFYEDTVEDAYSMLYQLDTVGSAATPQNRLRRFAG
jgi:[ribosomal protein S18]-alanine N-acetyltransferase